MESGWHTEDWVPACEVGNIVGNTDLYPIAIPCCFSMKN